MTQEEKQLLLIDLCARLPYGVVIKITSDGGMVEASYDMRLDAGLLADLLHSEDDFKPYLRPLSSMTEEEIDEIKSLLPFHCGDMFVNDDEIIVFETDGEFSLSHHLFEDMINFYNSHYFDYRGLIPMGLALEASEEMYKTE